MIARHCTCSLALTRTNIHSTHSPDRVSAHFSPHTRAHNSLAPSWAHSLYPDSPSDAPMSKMTRTEQISYVAAASRAIMRGIIAASASDLGRAMPIWHTEFNYAITSTAPPFLDDLEFGALHGIFHVRFVSSCSLCLRCLLCFSCLLLVRYARLSVVVHEFFGVAPHISSLGACSFKHSIPRVSLCTRVPLIPVLPFDFRVKTPSTPPYVCRLRAFWQPSTRTARSRPSSSRRSSTHSTTARTRLASTKRCQSLGSLVCPTALT